eukprot:3246567-Rhodomonas_salina.1
MHCIRNQRDCSQKRGQGDLFGEAADSDRGSSLLELELHVHSLNERVAMMTSVEDAVCPLKMMCVR